MTGWLRGYRRERVGSDLVAGLLVVALAVPQGMAYALLAGLPPVSGLYASILPTLVYAYCGSSAVLSVGPMAITSLMTAGALAPLAAAGSTEYAALAAQLTLLAGLVLLLCGMLRFGFLANLLSRPVLSGFVTGAALLIGAGQVEVLVGGSLRAPNPHAAAIGIGCVLALALARGVLSRALAGWGLDARRAALCARLAPVAVLALATLCTGLFDLGTAGVALTGAVPAGLPPLGLAWDLESMRSLFLPALLLGFMVFLGSQSAAATLAQQRGERIDTNRELIGLGGANLAAAFTGGFVVSGSLSRSAANHAAGARSPLAAVITALVMALLLCVPTGWLALLPLPALAALIVVSVIGMLDLATPREAWRYDRSDAFAWLATLAGVLLAGVEQGVVIGVLISLGSVIARASRPHLAVLGRVPGTVHFRNIERCATESAPGVLLLRVDTGLFFGNAEAVAERVLQAVNPAVRHVVLVLSAVNMIDTTGLYMLADLNRRLAAIGVQLHFAEFKGFLMDRVRRSTLLLPTLDGRVFRSTAEAYDALSSGPGAEARPG